MRNTRNCSTLKFKFWENLKRSEFAENSSFAFRKIVYVVLDDCCNADEI